MLIWILAIALALAIGGILLIWLGPLAARWIILVSSWIAELPIAWAILLCILFPPILLVLLVAMGFHQLGVSKRILDATEPKTIRNEKERAAKGYDQRPN
jgi:hypothetical protein